MKHFTLIGAVLLLAMLAVIPASATYAPVTQTYDYGKYAGELVIHASASPLLAGNEMTAYISNNADTKHRELALPINHDGTWEEWLNPCDFTIRYRECRIPVTIVKGQKTLVEIPVCDR